MVFALFGEALVFGAGGWIPSTAHSSSASNATEVLDILFTGLCRTFSHPSVAILELKGRGT